MQRRKVWLLFTAVIIAVFAMVGCLPEVTPDKTPPEITAHSAQLSATQIDQGDPVTVTVSVTAKDKRSNLKETVIKLSLKKPGETTFTQIATATVAFASSKEDTKSNAFQVAGTNFQTGGDYAFKAEITASDSQGNTSSPMVAEPSGDLHVQGATPSGPTLEITYPSSSPYSEGRYTVVPAVFNLKVVAEDPDSDLVELKVVLQSNTQTLVDRTETAQGVASLTVEEDSIAPQLGDAIEATLTLHVTARDSNGTVKSEDIDLIARKNNITVIESLDSVRGDEAGQLPMASHYRVEPGDTENIVQKPELDRLSVPFGLSKMVFAFHDSDINVSDTVKAYIYTDSSDIFSGDEYAFRAATVVNVEKKAELEVPNFWRQADVDEAKWLVVSVFNNSEESTPKVRFIWNITARGDTADPMFDIVESSSDYDEGVPLYFEAAATDELLEAITDLGIQVNIERNGWEPLEDAIEGLNQSIPDGSLFRFAVRYHVKVQMDLTEPETTYASGLVDDGIDYIVSNAVNSHDNIAWFDVYHGKIPGMPESTQTQADYWWKTDGLSNIIGEDDDDSYYGGNTPNEEPYATNLPEYAELDHRRLDKRKYVYEFTDLDTTKVQKIKREAFVEQAKFKVWIYPEIVRANKEDIANGEYRPEVFDVADVAIGPGTWNDQHVDYRVYMEVADWRWGGNSDEIGKTLAEANFTVEEDELSPTIEISGYNASQQNDPFTHIFKDSDNLFTHSDDVHYPLGMFFVDSVEVFSGGEITIKVKDDIALNDFLVYFDSVEDVIDVTDETVIPRAPFIQRDDEFAHPLAGFDYKYIDVDDEPTPTFNVFRLVEGQEEDGVAEIIKLYDFDENFDERKLRLFGADFNVNYNAIGPEFKLDKDYEYYVNFTNDDIVCDEEKDAHRNAFGNTNDIYLGESVDLEFEPYSGEYSNTFKGYDIVNELNAENREKAEFTFQIPDVEGDYYLWIVARDRSAQDTKLFDYPANETNDYYGQGSLGEYDPVVIKNYQNEYFGDLLGNANTSDGNPNYDLSYYDDSMSEDDADMVVLLKISIKPHSWDILRLDIHEPDLVSYPSKDKEDHDIWYSHSYSPWQVPEEFDVSDSDVDWHRLPRDMYPVYKFITGYKEKVLDHFGLTYSQYNTFDVEEHVYGEFSDIYSDNYDYECRNEYVPIVGGDEETDFRVRTHEDITKVSLYLVEGELWYNDEMEEAYGNLDINPEVVASVTMVADNSDRSSGFWEWTIQDWNDTLGITDAGTEASYTIAARAYHSTSNDPREFFEQFQWPLFVDTKKPELAIINVETEEEDNYYPGGGGLLTSRDPQDFTYPDYRTSQVPSYLDLRELVEEDRPYSDPYAVSPVVAVYVEDGGAIYFENRKGIRENIDEGVVSSSTPPFPPPTPFTAFNKLWSGSIASDATEWRTEMRSMRAKDLDAHAVRIYAGDSSEYEIYDAQDLISEESGVSGIAGSIIQPVDSFRMGYPGFDRDYPITTAFTASPYNEPRLWNSLKYLNSDESTETIIFTPEAAVYGKLYGNYMNEMYHDTSRNSLPVVYDGELPTRALFHNLDFDKYFWRDDGNQTQKITITMTDELGNVGEWHSHLKQIRDIQFADLDPASHALNPNMQKWLDNPDALREPTFTAVAKLDKLNKIEQIQLIEELQVLDTDKINPATPIFINIEEPKDGVVVNVELPPSYFERRVIKLAAMSESGYVAATDVTPDAPYYNNPKNSDIDPWWWEDAPDEIKGRSDAEYIPPYDGVYYSSPIIATDCGYPGKKTEMEINIDELVANGDVIDLYEELSDAGKSSLRNLLGDRERYIINFPVPFIDEVGIPFRFEAFDDNYDKYDYTANVQKREYGATTTFIPAEYPEIVNPADWGMFKPKFAGPDQYAGQANMIEVQNTGTATKTSRLSEGTVEEADNYGFLDAILKTDDYGDDPDFFGASETVVRVNYQNLDVGQDMFVQTTMAINGGTQGIMTGVATGVYFRFDSDVLYTGLQDLKDSFKIYNSRTGQALEILNIYVLPEFLRKNAWYMDAYIDTTKVPAPVIGDYPNNWPFGYGDVALLRNDPLYPWYATDPITGVPLPNVPVSDTWMPVSGQGRSHRFLIELAPYNTMSSRDTEALREYKVLNGDIAETELSYELNGLFTVAAGNIDNNINANLPPEIPVFYDRDGFVEGTKYYDEEVEFRWYPVEDPDGDDRAIRYTLTIWNADDKVIVLGSNLDETYLRVMIRDLPDVYFYSLTAVDEKGRRSYSVIKTHGTATLRNTAPADYARGVSSRPTFRWESTANVNTFVLKYRQVDAAISSRALWDVTLPVTNNIFYTLGYDLPLGKEFEWMVDGYDNSGNLVASSEITSFFVGDVYDLTVESSPTAGGNTSGTGKYLSGAVVPIVAAANNGYRFNGWTQTAGVPGTIAATNVANTTFTMVSTSTVEANFAKLYTLAIVQNPLNSAVITGAGDYIHNEAVTLESNPNAGRTFTKWIVKRTSDGSTMFESTANPLNMNMPAYDVSIEAVHDTVRYNLTLSDNPTGAADSLSGDGTYIDGISVPISAVAATGFRFVEWVAATGTFDDPTSANTNFTMPSQNVNVEARFEVFQMNLLNNGVPGEIGNDGDMPPLSTDPMFSFTSEVSGNAELGILVEDTTGGTSFYRGTGTVGEATTMTFSGSGTRTVTFDATFNLNPGSSYQVSFGLQDDNHNNPVGTSPLATAGFTTVQSTEDINNKLDDLFADLRNESYIHAADTVISTPTKMATVAFDFSGNTSMERIGNLWTAVSSVLNNNPTIGLKYKDYIMPVVTVDTGVATETYNTMQSVQDKITATGIAQLLFGDVLGGTNPKTLEVYLGWEKYTIVLKKN